VLDLSTRLILGHGVGSAAVTGRHTAKLAWHLDQL